MTLHPPAATSTPTTPRVRTLLVDDDPIVRLSIGRLLTRSERFTVVAEAPDGEAAVLAAAQQQPELAILDIRMPVMDGLEALPLLAEVVPNCRVVVLSAFSDAEIERAARKAGAKDVVVRDEDLRGFAAFLDHLLQHCDDTVATATVEVELLPEPTISSQARSIVRRTLSKWHCRDLLPEAELLTSEVVTNARLHGGDPVDLRICQHGARLRIEVTDQGTGRLLPIDAGPDDTTGRGLMILEAVATTWGSATRPAGRSVWFELAIPERDLTEVLTRSEAVLYDPSNR